MQRSEPGTQGPNEMTAGNADGAARPNVAPIVVVTCRVLVSALERLLPPDLASEVQILDYGLHRVPVKLTGSVQEVLDAVTQPSIIVLGYGLCGNGLRGIRAGQHTVLIPRTDDCIAILLGSYRAYMHQFQAEPGTYYVTKGWLESGSDPLREYEEYSAKWDEKTALWLMDQQYQNYKRLVLVAPNPEEMAEYRPRALEVANFCKRWGMVYEEVLGSDDYVRRLIEAAILLRDTGALPPNFTSDFLVIPSGAEIEQSMFMR
jgi:hypothetical protein